MSFRKLSHGVIVVPSDVKEMLFLADYLFFVGLRWDEVIEYVM
jgi:hypothetical protein